MPGVFPAQERQTPEGQERGDRDDDGEQDGEPRVGVPNLGEVGLDQLLDARPEEVAERGPVRQHERRRL